MRNRRKGSELGRIGRRERERGKEREMLRRTCPSPPQGRCRTILDPVSSPAIPTCRPRPAAARTPNNQVDQDVVRWG